MGQVDALLATLRGKPDGKVAAELGNLELTERVSPAQLAKWESGAQGLKTLQALIKLADLAAFLRPPAGDVIPIAAPDSDTQDRMLDLAADSLKTDRRPPPSFLATRETTHFEDTPAIRVVADEAAPQDLHALRAPGRNAHHDDYKSMRSTGSTTTSVIFRNGMQVRDADAGGSNSAGQSTAALTTGGDFGAMPAVVLGDAMRSQVEWLRWEQGGDNPVAVFRYEVPAGQSNYPVRVPEDGKFVTVYPAYHGEIAIDPASGAILRLSVMAELPPPYAAMKTAVLVEYGPVTIGPHSYIYPVHGVEFSRVPVAGSGTVADRQELSVRTQLDDVAFSHYHVDGAEAPVVTGSDGKGVAPAALPVNPPH